MKRPLLTVLTTPIPGASRRVYRALRRSVRPLVRPGAPLPAVSRYPGHYAVVRSVVQGLEAIGADFNHDPGTLNRVARVVYAPANEALRQAAQLKRERRIDFLVAGPSNALLPDEADGVLKLPEIDLLIVASEWVRELVRSAAPELGPKIRICTAGVDARFWAPSGVGRSSRVVVYWKSGDEAFCTDVERVIEASGLQPIRIRYGKYTPDEYKRALDNAVAGVFLSSFETQGLALAEAWSMDVPTLVWNPQAQTSWRGHPFVAGSSAPYLSVETGSSWRRVSELASLIDDLPQKRHEFHPRDWVLANMSDVVCSAALFAIIERESRGRTHSTPPVVAVSG